MCVINLGVCRSYVCVALRRKEENPCSLELNGHLPAHSGTPDLSKPRNLVFFSQTVQGGEWKKEVSFKKRRSKWCISRQRVSVAEQFATDWLPIFCNGCNRRSSACYRILYFNFLLFVSIFATWRWSHWLKRHAMTNCFRLFCLPLLYPAVDGSTSPRSCSSTC